MIPDCHGAVVVDAAGERIGTVERSYVDDGGAVRFVEVKIGAFLAKHRLVPIADAQSMKDGRVVPYTKDAIVASPDAACAGETLEGGCWSSFGRTMPGATRAETSRRLPPLRPPTRTLYLESARAG